MIDGRSDATTGADVDRFAKLDKARSEQGAHPAAKAAYRQPRKTTGERAREYAKIDHGRQA